MFRMGSHHTIYGSYVQPHELFAHWTSWLWISGSQSFFGSDLLPFKATIGAIADPA
jgi:hypothetical protein